MSLWDALAKVGVGVVHAAENKHFEKPEVRKRMEKRMRKKAEQCTPCASADYVDQLARTFGGG